MAQLDRVLELLWEYTTEQVDRLTAMGTKSGARMADVMVDRAALYEARLVADPSDWLAYPPNACTCPRKKRDWDFQVYSRSCLRGDHRQDARMLGQGCD